MLTTMIIGNKIAEARKRINISQAHLAERLFISAQAVGKWERGESMPDIITFNRLAEILGVDLNYFSEGFKSEARESDIHRVEPGESLFKQPHDLPLILTVAQAAELLQYSNDMVYALIRKKIIPTFPPGVRRGKRIHRDTLLKIIADEITDN